MPKEIKYNTFQKNRTAEVGGWKGNQLKIHEVNLQNDKNYQEFLKIKQLCLDSVNPELRNTLGVFLDVIDDIYETPDIILESLGTFAEPVDYGKAFYQLGSGWKHKAWGKKELFDSSKEKIDSTISQLRVLNEKVVV